MPEIATEIPSKPPWPAWLRDAVYFAGILVALVIFNLNTRSDLRSTKEQLDRVATDMSALSKDVSSIRATLPNPEVLNLRFKGIEDKLSELKSDFEFEKAKTQNLRERLIKKGWVE